MTVFSCQESGHRLVYQEAPELVSNQAWNPPAIRTISSDSRLQLRKRELHHLLVSGEMTHADIITKNEPSPKASNKGCTT